jgi:uncharacterized membrane protein
MLWWGFTFALTILALVGTLVVRIPIPATTGYFNLGDIFVVLAGLWLGPVAGLIVGSVGPSLADAIGFPVFIPATLVTKGIEGLLVGLIGGPRTQKLSRKVAAAVVGGLTIIVGYFVFEAIIYPSLGEYVPMFQVTDLAAAIVELPFNGIQAVIGIVGGVAMWRLVSGYTPGKGGRNSRGVGDP